MPLSSQTVVWQQHNVYNPVDIEKCDLSDHGILLIPGRLVSETTDVLGCSHIDVTQNDAKKSG